MPRTKKQTMPRTKKEKAPPVARRIRSTSPKPVNLPYIGDVYELYRERDKFRLGRSWVAKVDSIKAYRANQTVLVLQQDMLKKHKKTSEEQNFHYDLLLDDGEMFPAYSTVEVEPLPEPSFRIIDPKRAEPGYVFKPTSTQSGPSNTPK